MQARGRQGIKLILWSGATVQRAQHTLKLSGPWNQDHPRHKGFLCQEDVVWHLTPLHKVPRLNLVFASLF